MMRSLAYLIVTLLLSSVFRHHGFMCVLILKDTHEQNNVHTQGYTYVHIYMYVYMYIDMCVCMNACMYICVSVCTYVCLHVCISL